jgi:hypothetical protein
MSSTKNTPGLPQVSFPKTAADVPGPVAGTRMTREYIRAVGRIAYLWGWPLVNQLHRLAVFARSPEPGRLGDVLPVAPPGHLSMLTDYIKPEQRFVVCPNQDTVFGAGFCLLDQQPVVVQVPDFAQRFFVYQIIDHRTESFAQIGKQYATEPGFYLLAGPDWNGDVPQGITGVFRSSTNLAAMFPRVFQDGTPADNAAIQTLLNQIMAYPLSQFTGQMKVTDWKKTPAFPVPQGLEITGVTPETFFDELPAALQAVPPLPGEESFYRVIRSVLDEALNDPESREILKQTALAAEDELISPLFQFQNNGRPVGNGWTSPPNDARWGTDYLSRTATAKSNMYDSAPEETRYIYNDFDSSGQRLTGYNRYTVTFAKGEVPPVKGFWSMTLYNKEHFFSPNPLNRFSLGTKNKSLKFSVDGSLTLYCQRSGPGPEKEPNWLPAPPEEFSLYIRAYWPGPEILDGTWKPPAVERVK